MALTPDPFGVIFNLGVWDMGFVMENSLTTSDVNLDSSYNAVVQVNLANDFTTAFTFTVTHGSLPDSDSGNTTYDISLEKCDASKNFLPFAKGFTQQVTAGCDAQKSINFPTVTTITGATLPTLTTITATSLTLSSALTNEVPYSNIQLNTSMAADYLGYLGYSCFGNIHAANFFTQTSIAGFSAQMPGFDASFNTNQVMPMIQASTTDLLMNPITSGNSTEVSTQEQSLCYLLYKQLLQNAPERFTTADDGVGTCMFQPNSSAFPNTWYLPIQAGDVLQCIVNMNSQDDQISFGSSAGNTPVQGAANALERKYLVRFVVGGATAAPADSNDSGSTNIHNNNPGARL
jgi:hypothetical protein